MVIGLASKGLMTVVGGIAVMLGAGLGTCADTLLASIGRTKAAVKTGLFHLLFNVFTILMGMLLLPFFTQLVLTAAIVKLNIGRINLLLSLFQ